MATTELALAFGDGSSPFIDPKTWDTIRIAGQTWYGKIEIKQARRKYKWDVKDAGGIEGATQTYRGIRPEPFSIEYFIWTDEQWTQWKTYSQAFQYSGVKGIVIPVDVVHPGLNAAGISQIVCDHLGILEKKSDEQMWSVTVMVRQYFPPLLLNATKTPPGAATIGANVPSGIVPNPAIQALQAKIATLQAQAAALGSPGGLPP